MRDFFIRSLEKLIGALIVLMGLGVILASVATMASPEGGFLAGLAVLFVGALYVIFMGGFLYMALGIYHNTRRTADAIERLENK